MSRRGVSAPLAVQMESLKKSMSSRDQRRNQERMQRVEQAGVDIYDKKQQPSNATGGVQLGPESAAFAAVQRAAALAGPTMIHCDLCNANFAGDPQYKAHLDGPVHRKALAKAEAQRQRDLQLGAGRGAAESALAAAAWANGGVLSGRQASSQPAAARAPAQDATMVPQQGPPQQGSRGGMYANRGSTGVSGQLGGRQQGAGRGRGRDAAEQAAAEAARQAALLSHADLVASTRKDDGPISIGGWIPPSLSAVQSADAGRRGAQAPEDSSVAVEDSRQAERPEGPEGAEQEQSAQRGAPPAAGAEAGNDGRGGLVAYSDASGDSDDSGDEGENRSNGPRIVSFF